MASKAERLKARNKKITERFIQLSDKKYKNTKLYTKEAILVMLSEEFFLSEATIEDIVFNRVKYKCDEQ